jgi:hypothetical protein
MVDENFALASTSLIPAECSILYTELLAAPVEDPAVDPS